MEFISVIMVAAMAAAIAIFFHRNFEDIIPIIVLGNILWLYVFYCLDYLIIGYYTIVFGSVASIFFVIYSWFQDRNSLIEAIFRPGILVWLLVLGIIYFITMENKVVLWDELRLWGAYPKILYFTDKLQLTANSMLYEEMRCYMPGISLWAYFVIKPMPVFRESALFFAYGVYSASMLVSMCTKLNWRQWKKIPLFIVAILVAPTFCYNSGFDYANFYYSLFVDPIIGITLAYFLYSVFIYDNERLFTIAEIFSACALTILKSSGIAIAIIAIIGCFFIQKNRIGIRKALKNNLIALVISLGFGSVWQYLCTQCAAKNPVSFTIQNSINFSFVKTFAKELACRPIIRWIYTDRIQLNHSFLITFIFLGIVAALMVRVIEKEYRKKFCTVYSILLIEIIVFIIGLYITCSGGFGNSTPSFPRYTCTVLSAQVIFTIMVLLNNFASPESPYQRMQILLLIVVTFLFFPFREPIEYDRGKEIVKEADNQAKDLITKLENDSDEEIKNVFLVCEGRGGEVVLFHHRIYFSTIGSICRIKNHATMTEIAEKDGEERKIENSKQKFRDFLKTEDCQYIYIDSISRQLVEQYQELFDEEITPSSLWRIIDVADAKNFALIK